jgi:hypothetical protein
MRRGRTNLAGLLVVALACLGLGPQTPTLPRVPEPLAGYRAWRPLGGSARPVSTPVSILCAYLPPETREQLLKAASDGHGPHAQHYVRVYANPTAVETLQDPAAKAFRAGAVLAKEKLSGPSAETAEGVAFMIKRPAGFEASGGWEFQYYPRSGAGSSAGCVDCHRQGAPRDFVFGRLSAAPQEAR